MSNDVENIQINQNSKSQSLLKAAWIIAFVTIISKLIGFLRDVVIANFYGAGMVSDAYFYAYQIPAISIILLGGVGGPFHSAVVSVFSKMIFSHDFCFTYMIELLFHQNYSIIINNAVECCLALAA